MWASSTEVTEESNPYTVQSYGQCMKGLLTTNSEPTIIPAVENFL